MGQWVKCEACQGTGILPCSCSEEEKTACAVCHGTGRRMCRSCRGSGLIYRGNDEEEYEFVYDEY